MVAHSEGLCYNITRGRKRDDFMLKHVVMWKFKEIGERNTKEQNMDLAYSRLLALKDKIPQIKSMEVGKNESGETNTYDMVLIEEFENKDDFKAYLEHPEHVKVSAFIKKVRLGRIAVDYTFEA